MKQKNEFFSEKPYHFADLINTRNFCKIGYKCNYLMKTNYNIQTIFNSIVKLGIELTYFYFKISPKELKSNTINTNIHINLQNRVYSPPKEKNNNKTNNQNKLKMSHNCNTYQDSEVSIYDDCYNKFNFCNSNNFSYRNSNRNKMYNKGKKKYNNNSYYYNTYNNSQLHLSTSTNNSISTKSSSPSSISSGNFTNFIAKFSKPEMTPIYPYQALLNKYEGICNFIIFAKRCSLYIEKKKIWNLKKMKVDEFFENFNNVSAVGSEISFLNDQNEISTVDYCLTLSSLMVKIQGLNDKQFEDILSKNEKKYKNNINNNTLINKEEKEFFYIVDESLQISFSKEKNEIKIEFNETKPPHNRMIITDLIEEIITNLELKDEITMDNIDKSSWFCFSWVPLHSTKSEFSITSFLVYYRFASDEKDLVNRGYDNYFEIPIVGILPLKIEENLWLKAIKKNNINIGIYQRDFYNFKMALTDSIVSINLLFII